ncbi:MFS transporter [Schleiferilactobacillus perolens]|uniref:Transporter major facilitator superfamily MFS 1, Na xyloside symporter n=1 Tax=Schleiferilactobacillus perolens DSM 12744 TaxID=1423792 RepID=A0A0R1N290_9LACO|nr:MFS transporter [Schleiferilactobacillus perolens]KRL14359.1 transporter major facilitator superfamily MFS 1, Na xyloside symporter [Schleiferilactobacillus perolens DSM 12744]
MHRSNWQTRWPERISYGLSDAADNLVFQMMTMYLLFFYTDVYGLQAGDVAVLFIVARIADVVESPLVGLMIDHTHSRFGKSRPFFLWYAVPYVVFAVLTFVTPPLHYGVKLAWAYVTYLGLGFLYTAVNLPITSVLPTLSDNDRELTLLGVIRQFFGSAVQIIVAVFTLPLVAAFGGGNEQKGFLLTISMFAVISLGLILNTFLQIRERHSQPEIAHQPWRKVVKAAGQNKPWLVLSGVIFLFWLVTAIKNQTTVYYFKYVFNNQNLVSYANSFTFTSLIGVILIMSLSATHGNKRTMATGMWVALAGQVVLAIGVYTHTLPIIFAATAINGIGQGMVVGLVSIMIADTIRYGMKVLGVQAEGIFSSANDLGVNLGLGLGGLITGGLFDLAGYIPNHAQNAGTIAMINANYVWIPLVVYLVMIALLHFYDEKALNAAIKSH